MPGIDVSGDNQSIVDGDSTPQPLPTATAFGIAAVGQTGSTDVFTVVNSGTAPLTLGNVSVPAGFTLLSTLPASLAPGASASFSVQLLTSVSGTYSGRGQLQQ